MLIASTERDHIGRLFAFFIQGESLAHDCVKQQIKLCGNLNAKKFLIRQAYEELFHVTTFKSGIKILSPKKSGKTPGQQAMQNYQKLLTSALHRGDLAESLLGMQIILEGLGDIALERINAGFSSRQAGFKKVRQVILRQEDTHHAFGLSYLKKIINNDDTKKQSLQKCVNDYLSIIDELMYSVISLFEYFEEDPKDYTHELQKTLPDWIKN